MKYFIHSSPRTLHFRRGDSFPCIFHIFRQVINLSILQVACQDLRENESIHGRQAAFQVSIQTSPTYVVRQHLLFSLPFDLRKSINVLFIVKSKYYGAESVGRRLRDPRKPNPMRRSERSGERKKRPFRETLAKSGCMQFF